MRHAGGIAAILSAARGAPRGDLALAFTTDEESGLAGARRLAASGALDGADLVVVGEPTGLDLGIGHRGVLRLEVAARGRAAHNSTPREDGAAPPSPRRLRAPRRPRAPRPATLNVGVLRGGEAGHVVPERCTAQLGVRVALPASTREARKAVEEALAEAGEPYELRVVAEHAPFEAKPGPLLDRVRAALRSANPRARRRRALRHRGQRVPARRALRDRGPREPGQDARARRARRGGGGARGAAVLRQPARGVGVKPCAQPWRRASWAAPALDSMPDAMVLGEDAQEFPRERVGAAREQA